MVKCLDILSRRIARSFHVKFRPLADEQTKDAWESTTAVNLEQEIVVDDLGILGSLTEHNPLFPTVAGPHRELYGQASCDHEETCLPSFALH